MPHAAPPPSQQRRSSTETSIAKHYEEYRLEGDEGKDGGPPFLRNRLSDHQGTHWVAQCIECDIAAQAAGPREILPEIRRTIWASMVIRAHREMPGIESLSPAPERYRRAFEAAEEYEVRLEPFPWAERGQLMPPVTIRYRELTPPDSR